MRVVQIDPELFLYKLDTDGLKFYRKNRNALKKMWTAQGPMYWLRFLFTFQVSFEEYISKHVKLGAFIVSQYEKHIPDFAYIRIHKQFIEDSFDKVDSFIENVFSIVQSLNKMSSCHSSENVVFSEESLSYFNTAIDHNDNEKMYFAIVSLLSIMYGGFVDGVLKLLKKWQKESDISKEREKNIDLTIYYWKPLKTWECKKFTPSCFEKYLASHWAESLPKMLLTCDVHNIFNNHLEDGECSCQYKNEESIFGLLKDKYKMARSASLSVVQIYKPETLACMEHSNCRVKLLHSKECSEPYICLGSFSCKKYCETALKNKRKVEVQEFWKKHIVEVFNCKKGNKRNVSTHVESVDTQIETFYPLNENKQVCVDLEELIYSNIPHFRNAYTQQKRKEEYRKKLRKKLQERYDYDCQDPDQLKEMYDEAQRLWLSELCFENYRELFPLQNRDPTNFEKQLYKVKRSLTTVAIATSGLVYGRVVLPTKRLSSSTSEVKVSISTQKNTKKKKKKSVVLTTTIETTKMEVRSESITNLVPNLENIKETKNETNYKENVASSSALSEKVENKINSQTKHSKTEGLDNKNIKTKASNTEDLDNKNIKTKASNTEGLDNKNIKTKASNTESIASSNALSNDLYSADNSKTKSVVNLLRKTSEKLSKSEKLQLKNSSEDQLDKTPKKVNNSKKLQLNNSQLSNHVDSDKISAKIAVGESKANENTSDNDDELNAFYNFVVNGEEMTADSVVENHKDDADESNHQTILNSAAIDASVEQTDGIIHVESEEKKSVLPEKKKRLRECAYCLEKEVVLKSFKRCSRCKAENLPNQYFYCSRECQVADWEKSHRELHLKGKTDK